MFVSLYNSNDNSDTLLSATAPAAAGSISLSGGTVALPANSAPVNLTGPEPKVVLEDLTKPLRGGTTIPVTFNFQHAGQVTLQIPVEAQSYYWSTYSAPASAPAGGAAAGAAPHSTGTATPVTGVSSTATPGGTASATPTATP
jgi:hypothetical protein